jgi:hypothetical protein
MLDNDSQNNKIYFDRQNLAPYLVVIPSEQDTGGSVALNKKDERGSASEADAAAGGTSVLQRVSSFSILPRSSSSIGLSGGGGGIGTASVASTSNLDSSVRRAQPLLHLTTPTRSTNRAIDSSQGLTDGESSEGIVPSWRLRDRMKTVGVGLVMVRTDNVQCLLLITLRSP